MAFGGQAAHARPIPGAVATLGVSDRVTFLRKTYAHLGGALIAFALITGALMMYATELSLKWSLMSMRSPITMLMVMLAFVGVGYLAQRLAASESSRGLQYVGLLLFVVVQSFLLQPLLWYVMLKFGSDYQRIQILSGQFAMSGQAGLIIMESVVITLAIFIGLTLTVFLTKKDFSFMRGALAICMFAALGVIVASWLFGFHLGAIFAGIMILLMAGYVLYQTSLVMNQFPPQHFVAAALMLFSTIATMFFWVLRLMSSLSDRR